MTRPLIDRLRSRASQAPDATARLPDEAAGEIERLTNDDGDRGELLRIHGDGNCHICGEPKTGPTSGPCSYPHGRMPVKVVDPKRPNGFWTWGYPPARTTK